MQIGLVGAAPDTGNMGVSALFASSVFMVNQALPDVQWVVFDHGKGSGRGNAWLAEGECVAYHRQGLRHGRRYHRLDNLSIVDAASRLNAFGSILNPVVRVIDQCDVVLDFSGGDSFSDIYGRSRFTNVLRPKQIVARRGTPLILMPQTYGPYEDATSMQEAVNAVRSATMAWARDQHSYTKLRGMLGEHYDACQHRCGVDFAFALQTRTANRELPEVLLHALDSDRNATPLVGLNVSGLIYNDPNMGRERYGLRADYAQAVVLFLKRLVQTSNANVVLVPHVMSLPGHYESDLGASQEVLKHIPPGMASRVSISPPTLDQCQMKWLISQTDWFCGTRMHATIAALSSGVPTATVSYSDKAQGVFESCGQGDQVHDPRKLDTQEVVERVINSFNSRRATKESLARHLPNVMQKAKDQMDAIAEKIKSLVASNPKRRGR